MGRLSSIYFTHIHTVTSVLGTMARRMRRPTCTGASVTSTGTDSLINKISTRRGLRARLLLVLVQLPYYQYRRYAYAAKVATIYRSRSTAVPVPVHVQCAYLEY